MISVKRRQFRPYYSWAISLLGLAIITLGLFRFPSYDDKLNLILLIALAAVSEIAATYVTIGRADMAYEVGTAVSMAAIPLFGPEAAAVAVAVSSFAFWLFGRRGSPITRSQIEQLAFNVGMHSVAIFIAGNVFLMVELQMASLPFLSGVAPWLPAAIVYDQTNLWLLIGMFWVAASSPPRPLEFWRENRWAMAINITVLTIGGALLAFAVQAFDWIGIIIFFIPIALSSFAFRLYVRQMQAHLDNLENIIAERTAELKQLMGEKDAFLAVLTHDMKSPLTSIGIYASLLKKRPGLLVERPQITDTLLRSQETLLDIVNNILDLEKMATDGTMSLDKERYDVVASIDAVAEVLNAQATQKEITLSFRADVPTLQINADRRQVERVMHNLISNAVKYSPEGGQVDVYVRVENNAAVIDVSDNGYGIPAEELPFVFDRFRRVSKHSNIAAGTGLGLAISKALVEAHGGAISVTSEEDVGSRFRVTLPLAAPVEMVPAG